jgi:hypothetical protein
MIRVEEEQNMLTVTSNKVEIGVTHDSDGHRYECKCAQCGKMEHFLNLITKRNLLFCNNGCAEKELKSDELQQKTLSAQEE